MATFADHRTAIEAPWYLYSFLRNCILAYPIYAVMMLEAGITPWELSLLFALWSAIALAAELPSGVLADRIGRRRVLYGAALMKCAAFASWLVWGSFWVYLAGFALWGIASALTSGARQAYLYDALRAQGRGFEFSRIYARGESLHEAGAVVAFLTGGFAAEYGYPVALLAGVAAAAGAAACVAALPRESPQSGRVDETAAATLSGALREVQISPPLARSVAGIALLSCIYGVYEEYIPVYLDDRAFGLGAIGTIAGCVFAARAIGMLLAHRWPGSGTAAPLTLYAASSIALGAAAIGHAAVLISALLGYALLTGAGDVRLQVNLQHGIESSARATVTSLAGFGAGLTAVLLYLVAGSIATRGGFAGLTLAFALITLLALLPLTMAAARGRRR